MSKRVLIAEDEPHIVESLSFLLEQAGCHVQAVGDGDAAVERLRGLPRPDMLILDVMIPKRNGFEVLKWVKGEPALRSMPVMVLTAKGQDQDRRTAEQLGVDAFVTKPFSNRDIVSRIRQMMGG